ncbi:hypothetical protein AVEN_21130-1 [Araneus ventricosus]|uniref:Uncharacterized protein n=1 Tax=Araneus ventricosus TaxID=182803 RepID=A0A4Y2L591_ARAVE|nr:hypothetical protein AVEN_21130-1 [Araneus ventricosus]
MSSALWRKSIYFCCCAYIRFIVVLPTTPCDFSDSGIDITVNEISCICDDHDMDFIPVKIILNQFDNREKNSRDNYSDLIKHHQYGEMLLSGYIRKCKRTEKYRRKSTMLAITASREDIDTFTRELLGMNNLKSNHHNSSYSTNPEMMEEY